MHVSVATRLHRSLGHGLHESARLNEKLAIDNQVCRSEFCWL